AAGCLVEQEAVALLEDREAMLPNTDPVLRVRAEVDDVLDAALDDVGEAIWLRLVPGDTQFFGTQAQRDGPSLSDLRAVAAHDLGKACHLQAAVLPAHELFHASFEEVRVADEGGHEARARGFVDL